jgi:hypothetical protein
MESSSTNTFARQAQTTSNPAPVVKIKVALGERVLAFEGREADTLNRLIVRGEAGLTSIENHGPRISHYVMKIRRAGLAVETWSASRMSVRSPASTGDIFCALLSAWSSASMPGRVAAMGDAFDESTAADDRERIARTLKAALAARDDFHVRALGLVLRAFDERARAARRRPRRVEAQVETKPMGRRDCRVKGASHGG